MSTYKYPDRSIKRAVLAEAKRNKRDGLFRLCVNRGEKDHTIITSADSGSLFTGAWRRARARGPLLEAESTSMKHMADRPSKSFACNVFIQLTFF